MKPEMRLHTQIVAFIPMINDRTFGAGFHCNPSNGHMSSSGRSLTRAHS
jgi:hypothetical protein